MQKIKAELDEVKRRHVTRPPTPTRPTEPRRLYSLDSNPLGSEYIAFAKTDFVESATTARAAVSKDGIFRLSPIPASLPIPALPSSKDFRPLTDEMDDEEEECEDSNKKNSIDAYMIRSIDPIPIKPSIYRMPSNASLLDRPEMDIVSRSVPRSSLDVHMASCSSSPNVSNLYRHATRDSIRAPVIGSLSSHELHGPRFDLEKPRRTSAGSQGENRDEEQRNRWVAQLYDLLDSPKPISHDAKRSVPTESEATKPEDELNIPSRSGSPIIPRKPSPVSPAPSSIISATSMHPPVGAPTSISRASTAAAERERLLAASKFSSPISSSASVSHTTAVRDRDREIPHPTPSQAPYTQSRPAQSRRQSMDGVKGKVATSTASNLTRSLWAMQDPQQTSQRIS